MNDKKFVLFSYDENEDVKAETSGEEAPTDGKERRRHRRYKVGVLTEIHTSDGAKRPGITFNISESGAFLMTLTPLEKDDEVDLAFISTEDDHEVVKARVVHGGPLKMDVFWSQGIGFEFVEGVPSFFSLEFEEDEDLPEEPPDSEEEGES